MAVLNWGLGHATRSIPIISELIAQNFEVLLASDGAALELLKKEFPKLQNFQLPSYNIKYSKSSTFFGLQMLLQTPHILKTIAEERKITHTLISVYRIDGIISDNRWGIYSDNIPSVFITHQLNVISGPTTLLSSKIHQKYMERFDECWVPDNNLEPNLSGKLGHLRSTKLKIKYLSILSRFQKKELLKTIDILIILSGPEPQRSILENKVLKEFKTYEGNVILIRGIIEQEQKMEQIENISIYNFMQSKELEDCLNSSKLVISRSGYTTLLDLAKLDKKAFFIPTPGQPEQEYLAKRLKDLHIANSCKQKDFNLTMLDTNEEYKGLIHYRSTNDLSGLFTLFQRE